MPSTFPRLLCSCLLLAAALAGCASIEVRDGDMFRRSTAPVPADWLAQVEPLAAPRKVERLQFRSDDGVALGGLFMRHPQARATVLYFQGGGNHIQRDAAWLAALGGDLPVHVMVWDYRGTGLSAGEGGTSLLLADAQAAAAEARRQGGAGVPLVYWGYSMGTLVGAHLAQQHAPDALILEGTLTNAQDWADNQVPWYGKPFVSIRLADTVRAYDNRQALQPLRRPVLMLVGGRDEVSPPRFTRAIVQQMRHPQCATVVEAPRAGHGGIHRHDEARSALRRFVDGLGKQPGC
jgi:pimeloyl-ACP methyl ester carboxylesterase